MNNLQPTDFPDPKIVIPKTSFTTSGGKVNEGIFRQQVLALTLSVPVYGLIELTQWVVVLFTNAPSVSDETAILAAAAAHTGAAFKSSRQKFDNGSTVTSATGAPVDVLSVDTGPLRAGNYVLSYNAEARMTVDDATSYARQAFHFGTNLSGMASRAMSSCTLDDWQTMYGEFDFILKDGESIQAKFTIQRSPRTGQTPSGGSAELRRCRIVVSRVDDPS